MCSCENGKYLASITDILLAFLLITIALLIAASIYCYLIKYQAKQNSRSQNSITYFSIFIYTFKSFYIFLIYNFQLFYLY